MYMYKVVWVCISWFRQFGHVYGGLGMWSAVQSGLLSKQEVAQNRHDRPKETWHIKALVNDRMNL